LLYLSLSDRNGVNDLTGSKKQHFSDWEFLDQMAQEEEQEEKAAKKRKGDIRKSLHPNSKSNLYSSKLNDNLNISPYSYHFKPNFKPNNPNYKGDVRAILDKRDETAGGSKYEGFSQGYG
jgi:hypothetical protein